MEIVKGIIVILGFVCVFTYPTVELIKEIKRAKAIKGRSNIVIDLGLSEEYLDGYRSRLKGLPFDASRSDDWKMGWVNANQALQFID